MSSDHSFASTIPKKLPSAPKAQPPGRPSNPLHAVASGIAAVTSKPAQLVSLLNTGFAAATNAVASAFPALPAATLGSVAIGAPHAHITHPPSGPLPIPPTPLPPVGPVLLGTCISVLINGMPAARCGDLGLSPTCCGLPPVFEIFTGSSKVFIGGARAARQLDITYHCKPVPPAGSCARGAIAAARAAMGVAMQGMFVANLAAQTAGMAGDLVASAQSTDSAMSAALSLSAGMAAAQLAAQAASDAVAMAMGMAMGKDVCVPPGTPGAIVAGAGTVQIGGFPMPSWMNIAKGLARLVRGTKGRQSSVLATRGGG